MFINYAHRGASAYAPENTMSAFEKALELHATGIELDLQKTKDGKIVIFHDECLDRCSNTTGKVIDYTYEELLKFDYGSWFDKTYKGEKIVLFENFAKEFLPKNLTFAIELKSEKIEKETLAIIKKYAVHDQIYITSFDYHLLENTRKINPNIKLSWLIERKITKEAIQKLQKIRGTQICPKATSVSEEEIELAHQSGLEVRLWGVSTEEILEKVCFLKTEGMTVNFPDRLNEIRKKIKLNHFMIK